MRRKRSPAAAWLLLAALGAAPLSVAKPHENEPPADTKPAEAAPAEAKPLARSTVDIEVSAEGKETLPSGSRLDWSGVDPECKKETGNRRLEASGPTTMSLPACSVKLTLFVTGFDTKQVLLDLGPGAHKAHGTIHIKIKKQGPPEVD